MSEYYNAKRVKGLYVVGAREPFKLSRSKIELFVDCPRCFYLDRKLGVGRPPGYPFALNSAVDTLLKKEFDIHRAKNKVHPLIKKYGIDAVPVAHEDLDIWRNNFKGIEYLHEPTNFLVTGAIDDLWVTTPPLPTSSANPPRLAGLGTPPKRGIGHPSQEGNFTPEYIVVDYKATSKEEKIEALNKDWQDGYKRQMEIYQWLLRQNGYKVSDTGYFVYCNGKTDREAFDAKLEFDITLIPYTGDDSWIEKTLLAAHQCLNSDKIPKAASSCDYCAYVQAVKDKEG